MTHLKNHITDCKKSIIRLMNDLERYEINVPIPLPDWEDLLETLAYLSGFIACLEKHNLVKEPKNEI